MKKLFLILFAVICTQAKANDMDIVRQYCTLLDKYTSTGYSASISLSLVELFNDYDAPIYNDIRFSSMAPQDNEDIGIRHYLLTCKTIDSADQHLRISTDNIDFVGYEPTHDEKVKYAVFSVEKTVHYGRDIFKTKELFKLRDNKIWTIRQCETNFCEGLSLYERKNYDEAYKIFSKIAASPTVNKDVADARYYIAVMNIKRQGCKEMPKKYRMTNAAKMLTSIAGTHRDRDAKHLLMIFGY